MFACRENTKTNDATLYADRKCNWRRQHEMMRTNSRPNAQRERLKTVWRMVRCEVPLALCTDACRSLALLQGISYINRMLKVFSYSEFFEFVRKHFDKFHHDINQLEVRTNTGDSAKFDCGANGRKLCQKRHVLISHSKLCGAHELWPLEAATHKSMNFRCHRLVQRAIRLTDVFSSHVSLHVVS